MYGPIIVEAVIMFGIAVFMWKTEIEGKVKK
jgi:hypothetical protein